MEGQPLGAKVPAAGIARLVSISIYGFPSAPLWRCSSSSWSYLRLLSGGCHVWASPLRLEVRHAHAVPTMTQTKMEVEI
jgi:hypothetical protein